MTTKTTKKRALPFFFSAIVAVLISFVLTNFSKVEDISKINAQQKLANKKPFTQPLDNSINQLILVNQRNSSIHINIDVLFADQPHMSIKQQVSDNRVGHYQDIDLETIITTTATNMVKVDLTEALRTNNYYGERLLITLPRHNWSIDTSSLSIIKYNFINFVKESNGENNTDDSANHPENNHSNKGYSNVEDMMRYPLLSNTAKPISLRINSQTALIVGNYDEMMINQSEDCDIASCFELDQTKINQLTIRAKNVERRQSSEYGNAYDKEYSIYPFYLHINYEVLVGSIDLYALKRSKVTLTNLKLAEKITWHDIKEDTQEEAVEVEKVAITE